MARRIFHFSEGTSNKFWSIEVTGTKTLVHFGKVGTAGQAQEKEWPSEAAALAAAAKLIAEKTKKGYAEQSGAGASTVAPPAPAAIVKAPAKPKAAGSNPTAPATASTADAAVAASNASPGPPDSTHSPTATLPALLPVGTLQLERRIDLAEQDCWWAVWRPRRVLPLPEFRPFDRAACLKLAKAIMGESTYTHSWKWHLLDLSKNRPSQEESAFWLYLGYFGRFSDIKTVERLVGEWKWDPGSKENRKAFEVAARNVTGAHYLPLLVGVMGLEIALEYCGAFDASSGRHSVAGGLMKAFRVSVLPWMDAEQIDALLLRLRALPPITQPQDKYAPFPIGAYLLAMLSGGSDVQRIIASIPNNSYSTAGGWEDDYYQRPQDLILRLGTPTEITAEMRRIGVRLREPEYIAAWLATTEFADLDFVADSICKETNRDEAGKLMRPLLGVHAIEAVPVMFRLLLESKVPALARQWLADHPAHAITGAVSLGSGRGKITGAAVEFLTESVARGLRPMIEAALKTLPPQQSSLVAEAAFAEAAASLPLMDDSHSPEWLKRLPAIKGTSVKTPGNIPLEGLPQVAVGPLALNPQQLASLIHELSKATTLSDPAIFADFKQHATAVSLDSLVWKLFTAWMTDGAPPKQKWALLALGHLGSDAIALKLAPLIRKWPGESQHQRAVTGLQVLRMIGTDTALMQLNGIAQKLPFKGLKERAKELMAEIAQSRGLTKAELEDRIVPDCGLDERGARFFDFGPRQFELLLGSDLKPVIREASGKKRPDLPAPNASDDPALAAEAVAEWKLLKKNLREVLKIQTERLEQAMITGRRWTADEFHTLFVRHPLMTHLSRWVIWACYAPDGQVAATFRVNDDQTLTDSSDDPFSLPPEASIGIVHPLQLDEAVKNAWGQVQGDYEIISPFPQLGRPLYGLLPDEKSADTLHRGKGKKIAAGSMFGVFEKSGWIRDSPADAGGYSAHSKPFPAANLTAFAHYDPGLWVGGSMAEMDDQEITEVYFVPGLRGPDWWSSHKDRIPLSQVDPIVLSEVLRDLETILGKAK